MGGSTVPTIFLQTVSGQFLETDRQTEKYYFFFPTDRQTDGKTDRQAEAGEPMDGQTDRQQADR